MPMFFPAITSDHRQVYRNRSLCKPLTLFLIA